MADSTDRISEGRKAFERCVDAEDHNRATAIEDLRFVRLAEQWPEEIIKQRQREGRPCLTINRLPTFVRQVVNDSRQNKPSIKVRPADSGADLETAKIMDGLIRNIEYVSSADVAYDTAVECAVSCGFGYFRIGMDYAFDDAFDMDITIERISNPFAVYGDPHSTAADSSDWNTAFIVERMPKSEFERKYKGKANVDFSSDAWANLSDDWLNEDGVLIAEWWTREEVARTIYRLSDGRIVDQEYLEENQDLQMALEVGVISIESERQTKTHKVKQTIMSGADILDETDWPGRFIPIVPVYGEEFDIEGKRYFRSLIHNAKDAQRMLNFWRTAATELVALAPRVPYIGPKGSFDTDEEKWKTANTVSHPYLEYDGNQPPQRQPLDSGVAAGALQEALNASDDMKSIIGMYDASLGARSNETSGRAIMARQREGDIATFHFIDNLSRAIRHAGRILIDLIPRVYSTPRIIRVMGEDGSQKAAEVNRPTQRTDDKGNPIPGPDGQPLPAMYDLTTGKYDLTVTTGPSFTTRREEAAMQMTEMVRAFPAAAPIVGPELAKNLDWPGADKIAEKMEAMTSGQVPPEVQKAIEEGKQQIQKLTQENQSLKTDMSVDQFKAKSHAEIETFKVQQQAAIARQKAEDDRTLALMKIAHEKQVDMVRHDSIEIDGENGQKVMKRKSDIANEQIMGGLAEVQAGLQQIGQLVQEQGAQTQAALQEMIRIQSAPNEIVRDPKTQRATGVRKVLN